MINHKTIAISSKFIAILVIYFSVLFSNISYAQPKFPGEGSIDIWNSNILWAGQGNFAYNFTLDVQGIWEILPPNGTIQNLVITTNFGEIAFDDAIDGSEATRYPIGHLYSPEDIKSIVIQKAVGSINGVNYDFTSFFAPHEFKPVEITLNK
jgi:hypothetical protein